MADWEVAPAGWAVEERRPGFLRTHLPKEERARIVEECCRPGASLEVVARRHRVDPTNLRYWIRIAGRTEDVETQDTEHRPPGPEDAIPRCTRPTAA